MKQMRSRLKTSKCRILSKNHNFGRDQWLLNKEDTERLLCGLLKCDVKEFVNNGLFLFLIKSHIFCMFESNIVFSLLIYSTIHLHMLGGWVVLRLFLRLHIIIDVGRNLIKFMITLCLLPLSCKSLNNHKVSQIANCCCFSSLSVNSRQRYSGKNTWRNTYKGTGSVCWQSHIA